MPEVKMEDVKVALDELTETQKKYGVESAEYKEAQVKTDEVLTKQEELSQKLVSDLAEEKKAREETDDRTKQLELSLIEKQGKEDYKTTAEYKALNSFAKHGKMDMDSEERKTLRTDVNTQGGYLTHTEMDTAITKQITEISPVRQVARVRTITEKTLLVPTRTGIPTATYEGETEEVPDSESAYGSEQLTPYRISVAIPYTMDLLMTSNFDLESEIKGDAAEAMAQKEGNRYILGTGVKQPEGITVNPTVLAGVVTSTVSAGFAASDLTGLTGELKVGYNPMYAFNRKTLAYARSLEDGAGNPIWQVNLALDAPNTINGEPYILFPDLADLAANSLSVLYGDFMRGYTITDLQGLVIVRDEITQAGKAIIKLYFHKWNHGQVILPEAIVMMKSKA